MQQIIFTHIHKISRTYYSYKYVVKIYYPEITFLDTQTNDDDESGSNDDDDGYGGWYNDDESEGGCK